MTESGFDLAIFVLKRELEKAPIDDPCPICAYESAIHLLEQAPLMADAFDRAARLGAEKDEPEGARYIQLSVTLADIITKTLRGELPAKG